MPRPPRLNLVALPYHVIQRGNNKQAVFHRVGDYRRYLEKLSEAAEKHGCHIHAYVLMSNHSHILVTQHEEHGISKMMQSLGRYYVQYFNYHYERTGTLWEGRHKAALVDSEWYFLTCMKYIELNPVRAGMVANPADYAWSSHGYNAFGLPDRIITPHTQYLALGQTESMRVEAYRALFLTDMSADTTTWIRETSNKNGILGSELFYEKVQSILGRSLYNKQKGGDRKSQQYKINRLRPH